MEWSHDESRDGYAHVLKKRATSIVTIAILIVKGSDPRISEEFGTREAR